MDTTSARTERRVSFDDFVAAGWHVLGRVSVFDVQRRHPVDLPVDRHERLMRVSSRGADTWVVGIDGDTWRSTDAAQTWVRAPLTP